MNIEQLFVQKINSLPFEIAFSVSSSSSLMLYVNASAYSNKANAPIGLNITVDGHQLGQVRVFANEASSHKALVPLMLPTELDPTKEHTMKVTAGTTSTVADSNDTIAVSAIYMGATPPFVWNIEGPIPQYTTFKSPLSGEGLLYFAGSAWMQTANNVLGIPVVLDGNPVATSNYYINPANSHMAFPPQIVPIQLKLGSHQIGFSTNRPEIMSDANDNYQLVVFF